MGMFSTRKWIKLLHESNAEGMRGNFYKSIRLAEGAIQLNPRASEAYRLIGNAFELKSDEMQESGDIERAAELHKKAQSIGI